MINAESIRAITRINNRTDQLNILVIGATHERYEQTLCKTGHNFYSIIHGKEWDEDYAYIPENYNIIPLIPHYIDYDLILVHTTDRLKMAYELQNMLHIPIIRHTHTLPFEQNEIIYHKNHKVDLNTFISDYSMKEWGYNSKVVEHGLDTKFWCVNNIFKRESICLSVVNLWAQRDWACGWEFWKSATVDLPRKVLGKNLGLSEPASSIHNLRTIYQKSLIFVNTSLHSPVPMSLLEAMACGCAVVSTNNCMIPDIIESGKNGLLIDTPEQMNTACRYLLNNPEIAIELGRAAQETVKNRFNLDKFVKSWNDIFLGVLNK